MTLAGVSVARSPPPTRKALERPPAAAVARQMSKNDTLLSGAVYRAKPQKPATASPRLSSDSSEFEFNGWLKKNRPSAEPLKIPQTHTQS